MSYVKLGAIAVSLFALTAFAWASESDEIREKAKVMQREAVELAEQGHKEEAVNLKRKAMAMLEEAERLQHDRPDQRDAKIMKMKQRLETLRQKEKDLNEHPGAVEALDNVRREAQEVEVELRELSNVSRREQAGPHDEIARRLEHMRIAVEHLNHAGLHDVAEHVAQRAEAAERELHEQHRNQGGDVMHEILQQLEEIRNEVGRLRDEVNDLRKKR